MASSKPSPTVDDALDLLNKGSLGKALSACQKVLKRNPESTQAWFVQALVHQELGEHEKAVEDYQRFNSLKPEIPEAHYNLGVLQRMLRQTEGAIISFRRAIELRPTWADAHNNLGNCLLDHGDSASAANSYQQAIQFDGNHPAAWLNLSNLIVRGRLKMDADNALSVCQRAVLLNPETGQAYYNLSVILEKRSIYDDALAAIEKAVELNPTNEMWKEDLSVRKGDLANASLPAEYITELFDAYADKFDSHLLEKLDYKVPRMIFAEVTACSPSGELDVLDLGCGTGLCGELFHSRARSLVGVDLSPRMIDVAQTKNVYTSLHAASMGDVMESQSCQFDLVLAADVFVYVGDLSETFADVQRVLRPGGLFAFSVEKHEGGGFVLQPSRRFAYSLEYLRSLMNQYGFREARMSAGTLRKEAGKDVAGYIVVLEKSIESSP